MELNQQKLITALTQAIELANRDIKLFGEKLTVTHEFQTIHQAPYSEFSIVYTCPITGLSFKQMDAILWNDTDDIISNGVQSPEIRDFEDFKEFQNQDYHVLNDQNEWVVIKEPDLSSLMGDLGVIYRNQIQVSDYLPDWQNIVVNRIKKDYQLDV